jgi:hypothetical protein
MESMRTFFAVPYTPQLYSSKIHTNVAAVSVFMSAFATLFDRFSLFTMMI